MRIIILLLMATSVCNICVSQSPVGKWKLISKIIVYDGKAIDMHAAFLTTKPCAAKIVYEVNADGTYRLNAANSGCDEKYINIQQRLYSKTRWKLEGKTFKISVTDFTVGQFYTISFSGNKMICTGTGGEGIFTYQRL